MAGSGEHGWSGEPRRADHPLVGESPAGRITLSMGVEPRRADHPFSGGREPRRADHPFNGGEPAGGITFLMGGNPAGRVTL